VKQSFAAKSIPKQEIGNEKKKDMWHRPEAYAAPVESQCQ